MLNRIFASLLYCAISLFAHVASAAITIDTVPIGDLRNANNPATGNKYGGVAYGYRMGTYEVTVGQYTGFLNAVAATDTYALYNTLMSTDLNVAGIARSGASGSYSYSVIGSPNHPITYVSWGDAARFSNWLQNGQPTGGQNASTTEDGAYTLNGATTVAALNAVTRNAGAKWFTPTVNEWQKAAYYQPAERGGDADGYWAYPTRTNSAPYSAKPPGSSAPNPSNTANYYNNDDVANGYNDGWAVTGSSDYSYSQNYATDVGAYTQSSSYYGTYDQGGNAWEMCENDSVGTHRSMCGGSANFYASDMLASTLYNINSAGDDVALGFRVATVPEPSSLVLAALGLAGMAAWGWRRST